MLSVILKPVLVLVGLLALLIGVVHSRPADDSGLRSVVVPSANCVCWHGIEIDVTTRDDATRILQATGWVAQVYPSPNSIVWRWNGKQPALIDGTKAGLLQISRDIVSEIRIQTSIPFGDVWLLLNHPDNALLVQTVSRIGGYQIAKYDRLGIQAISEVDCPVSPAQFWRMPIALGMGDIPPLETVYSRGFDIYRFPAWWWRLRSC